MRAKKYCSTYSESPSGTIKNKLIMTPSVIDERKFRIPASDKAKNLFNIKTSPNYLYLPLDAFLEIVPHTCVQALPCEQFGVRAFFFNFALVDDTDFIGVYNRREAVGDHDDGFIFEQYVECLFDFVFVFGVGKGGCFVQHDNRCVLQEGAGNGKPLCFSA